MSNYDEPYEVKIYDVDINRDDCLSNISENTIDCVIQKIKFYKNKTESEIILRAYAKNEHLNNKRKARGCMFSAGLLFILTVGVYKMGGYTGLAANLFSLGPLLLYPLYITLLIGIVSCIVRAINLSSNSAIVLDSYSMKYKKWDLVIAESQEREKIYQEEIERLESVYNEMVEEKNRIRENYYRIKKEKDCISKC